MSRRLGIVGGGQLGGFICQAARSLGIQTTVLSKSVEGLAATYADAIIEAAFDDQQAVDQLIEASDVVTFELEDVPVETLQKLAAHPRVEVFPRPSTMLLLQNKGQQKDWLVEHGFPTAPHLRFDNGLDAAQALNKFGQSFVIKTQRGGYDGLGVKLVRDGAVPDGYDDVPTIAEAAVQDFVEIAVLIARNPAGETVHYPVFQSTFDDAGNVVRRIVAPAPIDEQTAHRAIELAREIVTKFDGVGIFAVEYFLTATQLLVNEIAPRVHNVGHMTIEASAESQFAQHIRAVAGLPLVEVDTITPAVMENLLWDEQIAAACAAQKVLDEQHANVHWYGKSAPRPLRKMGHLTTLGDSLTQAGVRADRAMQHLQQEPAR